MNKIRKKGIFIGIITLGIFVLFLVFINKNLDTGNIKISHSHGLAVDIDNSEKLYIATHHGLFTYNNGIINKKSKENHDFMGFTIHPSDPNIFWSSGHPSRGGNLGVMKSNNKGENFEKISNGANGPVDFHSMDVSISNPSVLYGWYAGNLQKSIDGGYNWEIINQIPQVTHIRVSSDNSNIVYIGTSAGLLISLDGGENMYWFSDLTSNSPIFAMDINPKDPNNMLVFTNNGMQITYDKGETWDIVNFNFSDVPSHIAYSIKDPNIIYTITRGDNLYKSIDGGVNWENIYIN